VGDKGAPSPAFDGSRLPLCRPFLQHIGVSVNPYKRSPICLVRLASARRSRASFRRSRPIVPRKNQEVNAKHCIVFHSGALTPDRAPFNGKRNNSAGVPPLACGDGGPGARCGSEGRRNRSCKAGGHRRAERDRCVGDPIYRRRLRFPGSVEIEPFVLLQLAARTRWLSCPAAHACPRGRSSMCRSTSRHGRW